MSDHNAYEDEMRLRRPHDTDDAEFSSLAEDIRSACLGAPGPDVQSRHIRAIIEQARRVPEVPVAPPAGVRRSRPLGTLAKLGAAAAALALLTGSLAVAGVDLPIFAGRPPSDQRGNGGATESAGDDEVRSETAARVQSAVQSSLPMLRAGGITGCEFRAAVSGAALGEAPDTSGCTEATDGEADVPGPKGSETARNVQAVLEENLPRLHAGEISGCEFGAMVSSAARGVEPDTSECPMTKTKTEAESPPSKEAKKQSPAVTKGPPPRAGSKPSPSSKGAKSTKEKAGGKGKGAAGSEAPGEAPEDKASKGNTEESQGQAKSKGKGAQPGGAPSSKGKEE